MRSVLQPVVYSLSFLLLGHAALTSDRPSVHASARMGSGLEDASISVEATDAVGLDSLSIAWPEGDLSYTTELSRSAPSRAFQRSFPLRDLFPAAAGWKKPLRLTVVVRNTRGATASTAVLLRQPEPHERK